MSSCGDDQLAGLVQLPDRGRVGLAGGPGRDHAPGAVVAPVRVPGDLLHVDAVLAQPGVDDLGQGGALLGGLQPGPAGVLGQHRPLLQHRTGVAQHPVDRHAGDAGHVLGRLAGADAGLDVARRERRRRRRWSNDCAGGAGRSGRSMRGDAIVDRQREQAADLVGEHQRLAVLGEGDEAYGPHAEVPFRSSPASMAGRARYAALCRHGTPNAPGDGRSARRTTDDSPTPLPAAPSLPTCGLGGAWLGWAGAEEGGRGGHGTGAGVERRHEGARDLRGSDQGSGCHLRDQRADLDRVEPGPPAGAPAGRGRRRKKILGWTRCPGSPNGASTPAWSSATPSCGATPGARGVGTALLTA